MDEQAIESRWGRDFPHPSRQALGPIQPSVKWALSLVPRSKAADCVALTTHPNLALKLKKK
jgi:hypothetical protein